MTTTGGGRKIRVVQLCAIGLTKEREGPARFLDKAGSSEAFDFRVLSIVEASSEEEREGAAYNLSKRPPVTLSTWFIFCLKNVSTLNRADVVLCQSGEFFWILAIFSRLRILKRKVRIVRFFYRTSGLKSKMWLLGSSRKRLPIVVTRQQEKELNNKRVHYYPFGIDTSWFFPRSRGEQITVPGNVRRREEFVQQLSTGQEGWVRVGRSDELVNFYRGSNVRVRVNIGHKEYRKILWESAVVVLPIDDCDEPAGLTAALEALACGIPVIASRGLGMNELHERVGDALQILDGFKIEEWQRALEKAKNLSGEVLAEARARVVEKNGFRNAEESVEKFLEFLKAKENEQF